MKITKITLENFGPYKGIQTIELDTAQGSPVVLIHGENMRGKTTFLHAVRWVLYGRVSSQSGTEINPQEFANWDLRDSGTRFEVSVCLEFEDQGESFILKRGFSAAQDPAHKDSVRVVEENLSLVLGSGNAIPSQDIRERINSILHEEISELFLFDGETLAAFEKKLRTSATSNQFVKDSIEKALGLSAITSMISDLEFVKSKLVGERKDSLRDERAAKETLDEIDSETQKLESTKSDRDNLERYLQEAIEEKSKLQPYIDASATLREKHEYRESLEEDVAKINREISLSKQIIRDTLKENFWIPAQERITQRAHDIEDAIGSLSSSISSDLISENRAQDIRDALESGSCGVCSQPVSGDIKNHLEHALESLKASKNNILEMQEKSHDLTNSQRELRLFTNSGGQIERISDLDQAINTESLRAENKKLAISELNRLLDSTESNFDDIENKYNAAITTIGQANLAIPELDLRISRSRETIRELESQLSKFPNSKSLLNERIESIDVLLQIYQSSIDTFRAKMRGQVEEVASQIFQSLTSENEYAGLRINNNYYLDIVDRNDRIIRRRSAGAEQVVAMSLIGALVECSVRDAPVIIDTPLGRLDSTHRKNILTWIPEMGNQVILLVTSTEFREPEDRKYLGNRISREFELEHVSAVHTEIVRRNYA